MINKELNQIFINKNFDDIYGQDIPKKLLKSALISGRNVIIIGPPGIVKTTLATNIAKQLPEIEVNDCGYNCDPNNPSCPECKTNNPKKVTIKGLSRFIRVQGSPDLTVEDLLGDIDPLKALEFGPSSTQAFTPGKIFRANNGILFFDELNRCPEKLQNALLQVLEEGFATIGSYKVDIPANFIFIATMNPKDTNTERLSDVLLDRFDMIEMNYPESEDIESRIILNKGYNMGINFPDHLINFITKFIRELRNNSNLEVLPSVRASLGLYERSQANAIIEGRDHVKFSDIQKVMASVLSHRIKLKPSSKYMLKPQELIEAQLDKFLSNHSEFKDLDTNDESGDCP